MASLITLVRYIILICQVKNSRDISNLKQKHPNFAQKFVSFQNKLDKPLDAITFLTFASSIPPRLLQNNPRLSYVIIHIVNQGIII